MKKGSKKYEMRNAKCDILNGGFSLVEVIFAMLFLTIIVFGVVKLQTSNLRLTNTQNNELKAHFLANQGAEIVEALGYGVTSANCAQASCECKITGPPYVLSCVGDPEDLSSFFRTVRIEDAGLTDADLITVLVEWTDSSGRHYEVDGPDVVNAHVESKRIVY